MLLFESIPNPPVKILTKVKLGGGSKKRLQVCKHSLGVLAGGGVGPTHQCTHKPGYINIGSGPEGSNLREGPSVHTRGLCHYVYVYTVCISTIMCLYIGMWAHMHIHICVNVCMCILVCLGVRIL